MRLHLLFLALSICACGSGSSDDAATGDDANQTEGASIQFLSGFSTRVSGSLAARKPVRIEYALDRLPDCRGNVGGGGPGWSITGYASENGGKPTTFEVTSLSDDGKDRVAKPATITPSQGGDIAVWFEVTSAFGCHKYDSAFGQNYHFGVAGAEPVAGATITFDKNGEPKQDGALKAGGKVKIRYSQDRLTQCVRTQMGNPVWTITGFAQLDREKPITFDTGRPKGSDRETIDALVDVPHEGDLALWFQTTSLGGCMQYDSKNGANYKFHVDR